jgi:hypothetical protein
MCATKCLTNNARACTGREETQEIFKRDVYIFLLLHFFNAIFKVTEINHPFLIKLLTGKGRIFKSSKNENGRYFFIIVLSLLLLYFLFSATTGSNYAC